MEWKSYYKGKPSTLLFLGNLPDPGMNRLNIKQTMALGTGRIGIAARTAEFVTIKLGSMSDSWRFSIIIQIKR